MPTPVPVQLSHPAISIVTVVRNGSDTIAGCLASVTSQSRGCEYLVIDGCSQDGTLDVVRRLAPGARILSEPDRGIYDAMNKGIALAGGEIVGLLNADDFYPYAGVLERVAEVFGDPKVMCCYGDLEYVRVLEKGAETVCRVARYWQSESYSHHRFYWGWMPPHPTFFVRRSVYERYGRFNLAFGSAADYELMLRLLLKHRLPAVYIPEVLVRMRVGGASNRNLAARLAANRMDRKAWEANGLTPYPWTSLAKPIRKLPQWVRAKTGSTGSGA